MCKDVRLGIFSMHVRNKWTVFWSLPNLEYLCQQQTNKHYLLIGTRLLLEYYDAITSKFDGKILIYIVVTGFVQVKENLESHGI